MLVMVSLCFLLKEDEYVIAIRGENLRNCVTLQIDGRCGIKINRDHTFSESYRLMIIEHELEFKYEDIRLQSIGDTDSKVTSWKATEGKGRSLMIGIYINFIMSCTDDSY